MLSQRLFFLRAVKKWSTPLWKYERKWHFILNLRSCSSQTNSLSFTQTRNCSTSRFNVNVRRRQRLCFRQTVNIKRARRDGHTLTSPATWGCSCSCCAERWRSAPSPRTLWIYWAGSAAGCPTPYLRGDKSCISLQNVTWTRSERRRVFMLTDISAEQPLVELGGVAARWWTRLWRKHRSC